VQDQLPAAARLFGTAATLREDVEDVERVERKRVAPWIAAARERLGAEAFSCEWSAGRALPLDAALAEAADLLDAWILIESLDPAATGSATGFEATRELDSLLSIEPSKDLRRVDAQIREYP
jgi:hypothetical protein